MNGGGGEEENTHDVLVEQALVGGAVGEVGLALAVPFVFLPFAFVLDEVATRRKSKSRAGQKKGACELAC